MILEGTLVKGSLFDFWRKASRSHFQISITIITSIIIYLFNFKNYIFLQNFQTCGIEQTASVTCGHDWPLLLSPHPKTVPVRVIARQWLLPQATFSKNILNQTMSIYNSTYVEMLIWPFGTCTQKTENGLFWVDSKIWPTPYVGAS